MPDEGLPEGIVTRTELAELAGLFDQFEFAFDPFSLSAREAESRFDDLTRALFDNKVALAFPGVDYALFYCRVRFACRIYLRKNSPS